MMVTINVDLKVCVFAFFALLCWLHNEDFSESISEKIDMLKKDIMEINKSLASYKGKLSQELSKVHKDVRDQLSKMQNELMEDFEQTITSHIRELKDDISKMNNDVMRRNKYELNISLGGILKVVCGILKVVAYWFPVVGVVNSVCTLL